MAFGTAPPMIREEWPYNNTKELGPGAFRFLVKLVSQTPTHYCSKCLNLEVVKVMSEEGAGVRNTQRKALHVLP